MPPAGRRGPGQVTTRARLRAGGFTMVELLVVLLIIALASGLAGLALRDGGSARLERDAVRLAALLESARAESRTSGVAVRFELRQPDGESDAVFRFVGLPGREQPDGHWLDGAVQARIPGARALLLGPEPLIGPQRVVLSLEGRQLVVATDGLAPFTPTEGAP